MIRGLFFVFAFVVGANLALADVKTGQDAIRRGDFDVARKEFSEAAKGGNPVAQYNLGLLYRRGQGVEKNYEEAAKWFAKAAEKDVHRAQAALGGLYALGRGVEHDHYRAYVWYLISVHSRSGEIKKYSGNKILRHLESRLNAADIDRAIDEAKAWKKAH